MLQMARPSASTATQAREALQAAGIRANVACQTYALRVVVLGDTVAAELACTTLRAAGFTGPANGNLFFTGPVGRLTVMAYRLG